MILGLYLTSLVIPGGKYEQRVFPGLFFFLIGPMGLGLLMAPANLFFLFGWTASIKGDRVATVFRAGCALLLGVLGSGACWHDMRGYPAFYLWIASFAALLVAGLIVPRPPSKGNCPFGFKDRRWAKRAGRRRCPLALAQPRVRQSTAGLATPSNLTRSTISARASWSRSLAVLKIGSMISGVQSNRLLSLVHVTFLGPPITNKRARRRDNPRPRVYPYAGALPPRLALTISSTAARVASSIAGQAATTSPKSGGNSAVRATTAPDIAPPTP